jgi:purine nucleoside permease
MLPARGTLRATQGIIMKPRLALAALFLVLPGLVPRARAADRIPIKVIALAGFEVGDDTGDAPGEFQFWVEREKLTERLEVPGAPHALLHNADGLYADVAGNTRDPQMTPLPTSELVMALCLDPQLDLSHTYWIVNGIAGIDPAFGPMGSAVWAENVVDGDAMREIDESEAPASWPYGLFAIGTNTPGVLPTDGGTAGGWGGAKLQYTMNYPLNKKLVHWAYDVSKGVELPDSSALKAWRARYTGFPKAQLPPQVMIGDALGSVRYWHGPKRPSGRATGSRPGPVARAPSPRPLWRRRTTWAHSSAWRPRATSTSIGSWS